MQFKLFIADIAFGAALSFLSGIFAASIHWNMLVVFTLAIGVLASVLIFQKGYLRECTLFLGALFVGVLYFYFYFAWRSAHIVMPFGKEISFGAVVSDEPLQSQKYLILTATTRSPLEGSVTILAPPTSNIRYGDLITVAGAIEKSTTPTEYPIVFSPKRLAVISSHHGFFLRDWMIDIKLSVMINFRTMIPTEEAAFLGGILFGSKAGIQDLLKQALSLTGTTHLVAVSGYKVTLVIVMAGEFFAAIFSRRGAFISAILFLVLFILMVGFEASAIRAAIMGVIALIAREAGEGVDTRNMITFTALLMAILNPAILTGDLSFMISFLAVLGIVYLGPPFKKLFRYEDEGLFGWKEAGITTLAAQLATMPVLMNSFGAFSLIAIPANIFTLSLLPLTMFFGFVLAVLGFISHYLAFFVAKASGLILGYQLSVIKLFAGAAEPLPLPLGSPFAIAVYYFILIIFIFSYGNKHAQKI